MVLAEIEIVSHISSLSRKNENRPNIISSKLKDINRLYRQRSWLIHRASWVWYKSLYLFLSSKNLNLFKFTIDTYLRDKNKMKNHFLMQGETRPCFIHKTVFLYFLITYAPIMLVSVTFWKEFWLSCYGLMIFLGKCCSIDKIW